MFSRFFRLLRLIGFYWQIGLGIWTEFDRVNPSPGTGTEFIETWYLPGLKPVNRRNQKSNHDAVPSALIYGIDPARHRVPRLDTEQSDRS